jgi:RNA polymerase sigma-70 factor (ECF subfamily)
MAERQEAELLAAGRRGDKGAISELFEQHYQSSLRVARAILRSEEEAEDAVQSAYLAAFRHLDSFRGDAAFKTWITSIVRNYCLMRLRQADVKIRWVNLDDLMGKGGPSVLVSAAPTPEKYTLRREIAATLAHAAARLPARLCQVFHLYTFSGLSVKEVAVATGLTVPAVKTRLFRAQMRVREHIQPVCRPLPADGF